MARPTKFFAALRDLVRHEVAGVMQGMLSFASPSTPKRPRRRRGRKATNAGRRGKRPHRARAR
jgi:hypothetical protein